MAEGRLRATAGVPPHDWNAYRLPQIWAMLEPQSRQHGVIAASGWSRMHRLCADEADALERALARLAERWPLTQPAAVAFQEWAAHLIRAMRGTSEAAASNGPVVDSITYAIDVARHRVAELQAEAVEYQRVEAELGREEANALFHERHVAVPIPREFMMPWSDGLDRVARSYMRELEATIDEQHARIVQDPPYVLPGRRPIDDGRDPLPRKPPEVAATGTMEFRTPGWSDSSVFEETVLDGDPPGRAFVPGVEAEKSPGAGASAGVITGSLVDTPAGRVLAPGGVIQPPAPGAGPASRNTPTAGLGAPIRSPSPGTTHVAPPMMMAPPNGPSTGGQPSTRRSARRGLKNVFAVPDGPPAVILPPEEPRVHDPGPGVFGIDR